MDASLHLMVFVSRGEAVRDPRAALWTQLQAFQDETWLREGMAHNQLNQYAITVALEYVCVCVCVCVCARVSVCLRLAYLQCGCVHP